MPWGEVMAGRHGFQLRRGVAKGMQVFLGPTHPEMLRGQG